MPLSQDETKKNDQQALAVNRTELAIERTQLAWVRTAFAIISAGLAIDQGAQVLHDARLLEGRAWIFRGHVVGIALSAMASALLLWATLVFTQRIQSLDSQATRWVNPVSVLSILVSILGALVALGLWIWG
jgi:putative membrane protein